MRCTRDECPFRSIRSGRFYESQVCAQTMSECRKIRHVLILVNVSRSIAGFGSHDQGATPAFTLVVDDWVKHYRVALTNNISQQAGIADVLSLDLRLCCICRGVTCTSGSACVGAPVCIPIPHEQKHFGSWISFGQCSQVLLQELEC